MQTLGARGPLVIDLQRLITGHIVTAATAALTGRPVGGVMVAFGNAPKSAGQNGTQPRGGSRSSKGHPILGAHPCARRPGLTIYTLPGYGHQAAGRGLQKQENGGSDSSSEPKMTAGWYLSSMLLGSLFERPCSSSPGGYPVVLQAILSDIMEASQHVC